MTNSSHQRHEAWMTAEKALEIRPDAPEGYWKGRPYFFLSLATEEFPSAGYHIWHDVDLQEWINEKDPLDIDFLVDISIALQIRGGLAKVIADSIGSSSTSLEGIHIESTINSVRNFINLHAPRLQLRNANWLDICSGNGKVTSVIGSEYGIANITHIDPSRDAYNEFKRQSIKSPSKLRETFVNKRIEEVIASQLEIRKYNGTFLINPWPNYEMMKRVFNISKRKAANETFRVVSITDKSDEKVLIDSALEEGFVLENRASLNSAMGVILKLAH